jgi:HSP20 family protein
VNGPWRLGDDLAFGGTVRGNLGKPHQFPAYFVRSSTYPAESAWRPPADIYRTRSGWLLKFEVAGVRLHDINVYVRGRRITITGIRRDCRVEDVLGHYSMEISYSAFERTVELPADLPNPHLTLDVLDGILIVRVTTEGLGP